MLDAAELVKAPETSRPPNEQRRTISLGRDNECELLAGLVADIRLGKSRSLVLTGEAGIGKTTLLRYLIESASDLTVARAVGEESEMELPFASLHQICGPMLDRLERLPVPQREALEIVFALSAGAAPDRFLVGLGVLSLFSQVAVGRPLLCVVDDAQWLDEASALTLAFVARRLVSEPVGIVFAAREPGEELQHLPGLWLRGFGGGDARASLGFVRRVSAMSDDARRLSLTAAAEPVADPLLLWRGAKRLGVRPAAGEDAQMQGLPMFGERIASRDPSLRSAVYRSATVEECRAAHLALAEATGPQPAGRLATRGDFGAASAAVAGAEAVTRATGSRFATYAAALLAALRGREADASSLIEIVIRDVGAGGPGVGVQWAQWVRSILFNGLCAYDRALAAAEQAAEEMPQLFISAWARPELIEAAVRSGKIERATEALESLTEVTSTAGSDSALGMQARSRALVSDGKTAEHLYQEALDRLSRTRLRPEFARAHLLYGEWLRRQRRRVDARAELRAAHEHFTAIGMEAFAERARRELSATGEHARKRTVETRDDLTAQERHIAGLARDGLSNQEIAARLFLSQHTVAYHLRKVFCKLEITSRNQLSQVLPASTDAATAAQVPRPSPQPSITM